MMTSAALKGIPLAGAALTGAALTGAALKSIPLKNILLKCKARSCIFLLLLWAGCGAVQAAIDAYPFPDETMQARYETLIAELRCPQCLNTNLAGSDAMIAQALRGEVHQMLIAGKSDDQVRQYLRERYGDFILYRPRWTAGTLLL
ncbi:MAG: cytochrome c-type biogenesis protein, partial [Pseudomonadales bacterium]